MKFRAFIAVEMGQLPDLAQFHSELKGLEPGVKAVDLGHLHVTLKFLGDTEESLVPKLEEIMHIATAGIEPFTIRLHGAGTFPPKGNVRVVWVSLEGAEPLASMASRLEAALQPLGFEPEGRPFKPHLTLARVKDPRASGAVLSLVEKYATGEFGSVDVKSILLKKSVLSPKGPAYTTVLTSPLAYR
ncbi:MAG: RNA 2',3'-cyclic phosphodiesterase [Methanomassiliicoccales archaeon]|nr:RNA 2',3'-cyclic phosphodiesterase [Methanomassiliicoccales archaeon]